jgi:hypothetical protein
LWENKIRQIRISNLQSYFAPYYLVPEEKCRFMHFARDTSFTLNVGLLTRVPKLFSPGCGKSKDEFEISFVKSDRIMLNRRYLPLEWAILIVSPFMFFKRLLTIEEFVATFVITWEKHFLSSVYIVENDYNSNVYLEL